MFGPNLKEEQRFLVSIVKIRRRRKNNDSYWKILMSSMRDAQIA